MHSQWVGPRALAPGEDEKGSTAGIPSFQPQVLIQLIQKGARVRIYGAGAGLIPRGWWWVRVWLAEESPAIGPLWLTEAQRTEFLDLIKNIPS
jgi:hypothetical protein